MTTINPVSTVNTAYTSEFLDDCIYEAYEIFSDSPTPLSDEDYTAVADIAPNMATPLGSDAVFDITGERGNGCPVMEWLENVYNLDDPKTVKGLKLEGSYVSFDLVFKPSGVEFLGLNDADSPSVIRLIRNQSLIAKCLEHNAALRIEEGSIIFTTAQGTESDF